MVKSFILKHFGWILPILAMIAITPWISAFDMRLSTYFYQGHGEFSNNKFFMFLFDYGTRPALLTGITALIVFVYTFFSKKYRQWRPIGLSLMLTLAIGSGLIVNGILKDHWGRPRPKQIVEFGGKQQFRPYYSPNFFHQPEPSKSFPSGHSSMGFYFFVLALIGRRTHIRWLFWFGMILAMILGLALSLARIAQGGHFLSDTLMSALIMWLVAYFIVSKLVPDNGGI